MKVKLVIFFVFGLFFCNDLESQDIIEQLKQFYEKADVDCYIDEIQENVNMSIDVDNKNWGRDEYGIFPQKIVLRKEEIVPMLTIQFINTDTFNFLSFGPNCTINSCHLRKSLIFNKNNR